MEKIIKQLAFVGVAAAMTLTLGCDIDDLIDDSKDDVEESVGFAPSSLDGKIAVNNIFTGTGDFATTGNSTITFSSNTYIIVGDGVNTGNDSGTYTYTKTGANMATLVGNSSVDGDSNTVTLSFTSPTSGSYSAVKTSGDPGTQTGTFIIN